MKHKQHAKSFPRKSPSLYGTTTRGEHLLDFLSDSTPLFWIFCLFSLFLPGGLVASIFLILLWLILLLFLAISITMGVLITWAVLQLLTGADKSLSKAPGSILLSIVEFLYSPASVEHTFKPIVADWRFEYFEALDQKAKWKARWIRVRYIYKFALAMGLSKVYSVVKFFLPAGK